MADRVKQILEAAELLRKGDVATGMKQIMGATSDFNEGKVIFPRLSSLRAPTQPTAASSATIAAGLGFMTQRSPAVAVGPAVSFPCLLNKGPQGTTSADNVSAALGGFERQAGFGTTNWAAESAAWVRDSAAWGTDGSAWGADSATSTFAGPMGMQGDAANALGFQGDATGAFGLQGDATGALGFHGNAAGVLALQEDAASALGLQMDAAAALGLQVDAANAESTAAVLASLGLDSGQLASGLDVVRLQALQEAAQQQYLAAYAQQLQEAQEMHDKQQEAAQLALIMEAAEAQAEAAKQSLEDDKEEHHWHRRLGKNKVCGNWQRGHCNRGNTCTFSHPEKEKGILNTRGAIDVMRHNFKTGLCKFFTAGNCPQSNRCMFAHGPQDLRTPGSLLTKEEEEIVQKVAQAKAAAAARSAAQAVIPEDILIAAKMPRAPPKAKSPPEGPPGAAGAAASASQGQQGPQQGQQGQPAAAAQPAASAPPPVSGKPSASPPRISFPKVGHTPQVALAQALAGGGTSPALAVASLLAAPNAAARAVALSEQLLQSKSAELIALAGLMGLPPADMKKSVGLAGFLAAAGATAGASPGAEPKSAPKSPTNGQYRALAPPRPAGPLTISPPQLSPAALALLAQSHMAVEGGAQKRMRLGLGLGPLPGGSGGGSGGFGA